MQRPNLTHCPDCDSPQPALIAPATPPHVVRRLCSVCGFPLGYMGAGEWFLQHGGRLDFKDEFRLLDHQEGDDDALAA